MACWDANIAPFLRARGKAHASPFSGAIQNLQWQRTIKHSSSKLRLLKSLRLLWDLKTRKYWWGYVYGGCPVFSQGSFSAHNCGANAKLEINIESEASRKAREPCKSKSVASQHICCSFDRAGDEHLINGLLSHYPHYLLVNMLFKDELLFSPSVNFESLYIDDLFKFKYTDELEIHFLESRW